MFKRKSIFALATLAALGTAALAPTGASAHWGGHFGGHWGGHGGSHDGGHWGAHWGSHGSGHWAGWDRRRAGWGGRGAHPYYGVYGTPGYAGPAYGGPPTVATPSSAAAPSAQSPATAADCLVKGYLPNGNVVFTDRCTHESVAGDGATPPGEGPAPQAGQPEPPRPRS
jgi:hypothetical protein